MRQGFPRNARYGSHKRRKSVNHEASSTTPCRNGAVVAGHSRGKARSSPLVDFSHQGHPKASMPPLRRELCRCRGTSRQHWPQHQHSPINEGQKVQP
eukprot:3756899-Amphidinium_carterae.1